MRRPIQFHLPVRGRWHRAVLEDDHPEQKNDQTLFGKQAIKKLDRDEARLLASVERGDWKRPTTAAKDITRLQGAARATGRKDKRVNIRITARDLAHLQRAALEEGIPCQTFISSILHKFIAGRLVERSRPTSA